MAIFIVSEFRVVRNALKLVDNVDCVCLIYDLYPFYVNLLVVFHRFCSDIIDVCIP